MSVINGRGIFAGGGGFKSYIVPKAIFDGSYSDIKRTNRYGLAFDGTFFYYMDATKLCSKYDMDGNLISSFTFSSSNSYYNISYTKYGVADQTSYTSKDATFSHYDENGNLIRTLTVTKPTQNGQLSAYQLPIACKETLVVLWNQHYSSDVYKISFVDEEGNATSVPLDNASSSSGNGDGRKRMYVVNHTFDDYIVTSTHMCSVMYDANETTPYSYTSVIWPKYKRAAYVIGSLFLALPFPFGAK